MGIKLIKKTNEAAYTAIKNPKQAAFIIDCGSPEKAKELNDAFSALAEKVLDHDDKEAGDAIGRNVILYYDVGPYFTACVDPCDKAVKWCEDWLRNSAGAVPGIQGNSAGLESKGATNEDDVGARLRDILNANDVWSEVSGGDNDSLVDNILDGDWIGLMCGPNSDDAADWDAYIKDTFGPFSQYVVAEWFSPDENDPNFKTVHIKFKPRFALSDKEKQTSVLNDLGSKIADGYFAMAEKRHEALSPKMQKRLKLKGWQDNTMKMKGFDEAGYSFLDLYDNGKCSSIVAPTKGYDSEKEALDAGKKIFDDFDEYLDVTAYHDEEGGPNGEAVWFPAYALKKTFVDLPEGEGLEVLSELSDVLYRLYTKGESASEDRRGTDRYGHHVKRFTTKDLKGLDGDAAGDNGGNGADAGAGADDKFGLAYMDTTSISAFSNNFSTSARDNFLHDLAQMPVSKKSIEDLLRKHQLHKYGREVGVRDFFPDNGIAYLGTYGDDGLPYKSLYLKWGPALKK